MQLNLLLETHTQSFANTTLSNALITCNQVIQLTLLMLYPVNEIVLDCVQLITVYTLSECLMRICKHTDDGCNGLIESY